MNDVQTLVDSLAARLRRPVGVDDRRFRALAYSSHADEIDAVRRASILGRQAPEAVTRWLRELGVFSARGFLRVPENPELEMVARVCFPVRFHERLLGFMWLVDDDAPLDDDELATCQSYAETIAHELYRLQRQGDDERGREAESLARLLRPGASDASAGRTASAVPISAAALYAVLVIDAGLPTGTPTPPGVDVRLTEAVDRLRRVVAPHHQLAAVTNDTATIALAAASAAEFDAHARRLADAVRAEMVDVAGAAPLIGLGDAVSVLSELPSSEAHARLAAQLGRSLSDAGPVVAWSELGVTRLLGELLDGRDPGALLPTPLQRLLSDSDGELLVNTLEAYLEHGGDAAAAAAELFVHRSSLYNRLHRIEELAGINIRSGADRLEMHLGIRLWRLR